ncbi:MAG: adenosyl-hopene transferase HpnH [Opitutales bacterium]
MPVPAAQAAAVASYIVKQKLSGKKRYPLVLMLEPLFRCNLACEGCGKIQFPNEILKKSLTAEQSLAAAEECGAPVVSIAGGEPLIWPDLMPTIEGLIQQKRWIHLCTNAVLLKRNLDKFEPNNRLAFTIHLDGLEAEHDRSVCRKGVYEIAVEAIKEALARGHRVTANCTLFNNADPQRVRAFFDEMMELGLEGIVMSPGYPYEKAPNQEIFLERDRTKLLFKQILDGAKKEWRFNHSPNFLAFLRGDVDYDCTPWGNPCYNIFGWQKPCYLLGDGYAKTFQELIEDTEWERYGQKGTDERCKDCMVHCGYEASAVDDTFSPSGLMRHFRSEASFGREAEYTADELAVIAGDLPPARQEEKAEPAA